MASRLPGAPRRTASTSAASSARAPFAPADRPSIEGICTDTPSIGGLSFLTCMAGTRVARTGRTYHLLHCEPRAGRHPRVFFPVGRLGAPPRDDLDDDAHSPLRVAH